MFSKSSGRESTRSMVHGKARADAREVRIDRGKLGRERQNER